MLIIPFSKESKINKVNIKSGFYPKGVYKCNKLLSSFNILFDNSWDEWVGVDRLMKYTEENIQKQQALDKKQGVDKNPKSGRSTQTKPKVVNGIFTVISTQIDIQTRIINHL